MKLFILTKKLKIRIHHLVLQKKEKTSMWLAIESVKEKNCDIVISAGNTGALLCYSKTKFKNDTKY